MRTPEEKVADLHTRMAVFRRTRERRKTKALSLVSAALTICLLFMVFGGANAFPGSSEGSFTGTMLFENAGGYALTAVIAFMAGMAITLVCLRSQFRGKQQAHSQENKEQIQDNLTQAKEGGN